MSISTIIAASSLVLGTGALIALFLHLVAPKKFLPRVVARYGGWIGLCVSLSALAVSLYYSEVLNYPPCDLCILQRIFIYPQVLVFGYIALWNDKRLLFVPLVLSLIGGLVSIYHNYLDWGGEEFVTCGTTFSCTQRFVSEFGFVTIPLMSLIGFVIIIAITIISMREGK